MIERRIERRGKRVDAGRRRNERQKEKKRKRKGGTTRSGVHPLRVHLHPRQTNHLRHLLPLPLLHTAHQQLPIGTVIVIWSPAHLLLHLLRHGVHSKGPPFSPDSPPLDSRLLSSDYWYLLTSISFDTIIPKNLSYQLRTIANQNPSNRSKINAPIRKKIWPLRASAGLGSPAAAAAMFIPHCIWYI